MRWIACLIVFFAVCVACAGFAGRTGPVRPFAPTGLVRLSAPTGPADAVDPLIGTAKSVRPTMWESNGATFPGVLAPFGMVQITPDGYRYTDTRIRGFSYLDHGSGWGSSGRFLVLPYTGDSASASLFDHRREEAHPWRYDVDLLDYSIHAAFVATVHAGFARFRFAEGLAGAGGAGARAGAGAGGAHVLLSDVTGVVVTGDTALTGRCGGTWLTARFSQPFRVGAIDSSSVRLDFTSGEGVVDIRTGFSMTSLAAAVANLLAEMPDFDFERYSLRGRELWNRTLGQIEIKGSDAAHRKVFYTALYHSYFMPAIISDAGVAPLRFTPLYPWDTYRSEHPLITLLDPEAEGEMIASTLREYDKTGWLPTGNMLGNHNVELILDGYVKGVRNFDVEKARAAIRKSLMVAPYARRDMKFFNTLGYVPAAHVNSVSQTLEFAYNDWAGSVFLRMGGSGGGGMGGGAGAGDHGFAADADTLLARSFAYERLYDPGTGFMRAKTDSGVFTDGGYCEGTAWTYSWFVPHDVRGLVNLMGGVRHFSDRLTECFDKGYYIHDNEPPLHMAYLFDFIGEPWKTQEYVRGLTEHSYTAVPGGLPGNDDLGALSSWYVFSAMGFYPVTPGVPDYELGSPVFGECILHLPNGKTFTIRAPGSSSLNKYVRGASLNGRSYSRPWISHADIVAGGTLTLEMGPAPNKQWGVGADDAPFSATTGHPAFTIGRPGLAIGRPGAGEAADRTKGETLVAEAGEAVDWVCRISNDGAAAGSIQLDLCVDGHFYCSRSVVIDSGDTMRVSIPVILYGAGEHAITLGQTGFPQRLVVRATPATFVYSALSAPLPPVVMRQDSFFVGVSVKNTGSTDGATRVVLFVDHRPVQERMVAVGAGEEKQVRFCVAGKDCPSAAIVGINELAPRVVRVVDDAGTGRPTASREGSGRVAMADAVLLRRMGALTVLDFDDGPGARVADRSGLGNEGIVHGTPRWVDGLFGKAVQLDATRGSYIELRHGPSLDTLVHSDSMTMMAWIYPMEEENFADILCRGDWHTLQLKASNTVVNFYTAGWEGHEAFAPVPANWNRHWHHLAGVTRYPYEELYIDGRLAATKRMELRDPNGETGLADYSNHPWSIGRNDGDPTRLFKGYIDDVMIFNKALSQEEINRLMMHLP